MSDSEIWEIMMKPSVVVNHTGSSLRLKVYEAPSLRSKAIGLICVGTQGLEILSLEDGWAQIRTANYNDGTS
jgi:hypothetical protein